MLALCIRRVSCNVACVSCNITGNTCNIKRNTCNITQNTCNITWNTSASVKYTKPTMLRSIRVIEVITHNITFPRITFRIFLPWVSRREVVNCGMGKITWFYFLDNHVHSALFILHFTFRIPHFTDTTDIPPNVVYISRNCSHRWKETLSRVIYCCSPCGARFLRKKINSVQTTVIAQLSKCTQVVR